MPSLFLNLSLSFSLSVSLSVCPCVGCGLSLKHGNAFTANNSPLLYPPLPSAFLAVLLARMLLPFGQSITLQVGNKVVKTNGLRDKMRLLKLHVCKLTSCITVYVCVLVYLALPTSQNSELGQRIWRSFSCSCFFLVVVAVTVVFVVVTLFCIWFLLCTYARYQPFLRCFPLSARMLLLLLFFIFICFTYEYIDIYI